MTMTCLPTVNERILEYLYLVIKRKTNCLNEWSKRDVMCNVIVARLAYFAALTVTIAGNFLTLDN